MAGVATYTKSGTKSSTAVTLSKKVFSEPVENHELLKLAYISYMGNNRPNLAKTKKRGEVRGGGRKPWVQKGTGRARHGSIRSPLWAGGGVTFGPSGEENYTKRLSKQAKKKALKQALTLAAKNKKVFVIEAFDCKEGKVNATQKLFKKIGAEGRVLLVVSVKDELVVRATRNLPNAKAVQADYITVYDILNSDSLVISKKSLEEITNWLGGDK